MQGYPTRLLPLLHGFHLRHRDEKENLSESNAGGCRCPVATYGGFTPYVTSFRRKFFAHHHTVKHPHTNIILSLFSIPLVLKCAAKILKISLQINILTSKNVFE